MYLKFIIFKKKLWLQLFNSTFRIIDINTYDSFVTHQYNYNIQRNCKIFSPRYLYINTSIFNCIFWLVILSKNQCCWISSFALSFVCVVFIAYCSKVTMIFLNILVLTHLSVFFIIRNVRSGNNIINVIFVAVLL